MGSKAELLPGTLDLLVLKATSLGPQHGYGVLLRIQQISGGALTIEQGALYPALYRLEHQGLLTSEWGTSDSNRKAKFYRLTAAGRKRLGQETASWFSLVAAMAAALEATVGRGVTCAPGCGRGDRSCSAARGGNRKCGTSSTSTCASAPMRSSRKACGLTRRCGVRGSSLARVERWKEAVPRGAGRRAR